MAKFQIGDTVYLCNPQRDRSYEGTEGIKEGSQWKVVCIDENADPLVYECEGPGFLPRHFNEDELCPEEET